MTDEKATGEIRVWQCAGGSVKQTHEHKWGFHKKMCCTA